MTTGIENLLAAAHLLFDTYSRGPMLNNCDPECCPNNELNTSLLLPLQDIPEQSLLDYYYRGPDHIGELNDYKYFLPIFAEKLLREAWDPWFISQAVLYSSSADWTSQEVAWLIRLFEMLGERLQNEPAKTSWLTHLDMLGLWHKRKAPFARVLSFLGTLELSNSKADGG